MRQFYRSIESGVASRKTVGGVKKSNKRNDLRFSFIWLSPCVRGESSQARDSQLLHRYINDLQLRILMVPLRGDSLKGQSERLALSGGEWRDSEIDRIRVRATGLQHAQGNGFALSELSHGISERDIDIGHRRAHEVLGRAHLQIGKFDIRSIGRRPGGSLLFGARDQK